MEGNQRLDDRDDDFPIGEQMMEAIVMGCEMFMKQWGVPPHQIRVSGVTWDILWEHWWVQCQNDFLRKWRGKAELCEDLRLTVMRVPVISSWDINIPFSIEPPPPPAKKKKGWMAK